MKKLLIVANWKSNMTTQEGNSWIEQSVKGLRQSGEKTIVICPPFTLLPSLSSYITVHKLDCLLGAQDVSPFPKGAYTGEVAAEQLSEFVKYTIIGHSERRKYFNENDQLLANKVDMALEAKLTPIFCVQDEETLIPKGVTIVAYEPTFAIGTGEPDSPENANAAAEAIKQTGKVKTVLYGGSVDSGNVHSFTKMGQIDGVLVGSASLNFASFNRIIEEA